MPSTRERPAVAVVEAPSRGRTHVSWTDIHEHLNPCDYHIRASIDIGSPQNEDCNSGGQYGGPPYIWKLPSPLVSSLGSEGLSASGPRLLRHQGAAADRGSVKSEPSSLSPKLCMEG